MKLKNYIKKLQDLYSKHGDIDVKFSTTYEVIGNGDFEYETDYTKAEKPYYNKANHCIVVHEEFVGFDN